MPSQRITRLCAYCRTEFFPLLSQVKIGWGKFCSARCRLDALQRQAAERLVERFWSHVQKKDDPDSCWPWTAARDLHGYGLFRTGSTTDGSRHSMRASVFALEMQLGRPLAPDMKACHTCDNPPCVRNDGEQSHLFEGTTRDNNRDSQLKGRKASAKVSPEQVLEIRRRRSDGESYSSLMKAFDLQRLTIFRICTGRTWAVIEDTDDAAILPGGMPRGEQRAGAKLTSEQVVSIRQRHAQGATYVALAAEFGIGQRTVGKIVKRQKWTHIP